MARAALGWGVRDLARVAGISPDTVARLERGEDIGYRTQAAIRNAFEAAGLELLEGTASAGEGVRVRHGAD